MRVSRKLKYLCLCCGLLLGILLPLNAVAGPIQIKIATLAPEGSPWLQTFNRINEDLKKSASDQIQLKIYPGGVLGDERDMLRIC